MRYVVALSTVLVLVASLADAAPTPVASFGSNPGGLAMYEYVPAGLPAGRPLVVVLHGCTQTAAAMESAGWNKLADQYQFAVLYPEQATANNPVRCFNWAGEYGDTANLVRGQGENQSVISMIDQMHTTRGIDTSKVYVVGFSAGAAFVSVMLATWPDRFAAGAIMEGIAYRCATSVNGAYSCQSPGVDKTPAAWGDLVRAAHAYTGPRPRVQIWQGTSDTTVAPANQAELVDQWTNVHGTDATADETTMIGTTVTRTAYKAGTTTVVETYTVQGMAHAVSVGAEGTTACPGTTAAYFEAKPVCSTLRAAAFFGVVPSGGGGGSGSGSGSAGSGAPYVSIVSPADGSSVSGTVTVVVAAGDDTGVTEVALEVDGGAVGTDADAPYQFTWTAPASGSHTLTATARDSDGNESTATATVTIGAGGGGSGTGSNDPDDEAAGLPSCSFDAGRHGGGTGWALIALAAVFAVRRRRRRAQKLPTTVSP
jgi:poly(hydroxyalkanoate) depolymerase family esterase